MRGLTLRQPWAVAVASLGKRVENRRWKPPAALVGQDLAIHSGLGHYVDGLAWMWRHKVDISAYQPVAGAIVAVVKLAGFIAVGDDEHMPGDPPPELPTDQRVWWIGPVGWMFEDVRALQTPVPHRGAQGLWTVAPDALAAIRAQIG